MGIRCGSGLTGSGVGNSAATDKCSGGNHRQYQQSRTSSHGSSLARGASAPDARIMTRECRSQVKRTTTIRGLAPKDERNGGPPDGEGRRRISAWLRGEARR